MALLIGGLALAYGARKYHKHEQKIRNAAEYDYSDLSLRSAMSMLVHGVYFRDLDRLGDTAATFLGYQNGRAENYGKRHWVPFRPIEMHASELKKLGLEFLLRKDAHPNNVAPRLAIVLRGTILQKMGDLVADVKISVGLLHKTNRIRRTQELVWEVVQAFRKGYGTLEQICLTGHSLGGAIALQVGRYLVGYHGVAIDTHVFNPPFLTLVDFATLNAIPRPSAPHNQRQRDPNVWDASNIQTVAKKNPSDSAIALEVVFSENRALQAEWTQFQKLEHWTPHFYLNPGDVVCHRYIKYFKKRHETATCGAHLISPQGILMRLLGKDAKYITDVVPSADLHISIWEKDNPVLAHSLRQWHKYTDEKIGLHRFQARLLHSARRHLTGHLTQAYEIGKTMLRPQRGEKHYSKVPAFTGASNSEAVVKAAAAAAGYGSFLQAGVAVAGYEALLLQYGYDAEKPAQAA